ncbi:hypothetical protein BX616_010605 [Lobosporangium transversale]|uniref:Uncharacterized protein n=1 Tax=Lobosporangium transversale TaxID=64571 RepID=A0A1Y2GE62_9FUNG|nr:hypothetical protein BCR41DRAFT_399371 [Lobosporangium transversale]KAF9911399.1 hypothetical protein BX616_010605 [Lobosporangium transversale]ORZ08291.1 hypothetical protein BCR41DRAFT_399371 [Lobosporangium transversale]|eukprot:XP_021878374.1 hypothetical protein BCR41DRAFT_399371 [Lobosporangium transversale]
MPLGTGVVLECRENVVLFDGSNFSAVPESKVQPGIGFTFVTMPGPVPFVLMAQDYKLFSIPLSGPNAGKVYDAKPIRIPDTSFDNLAPNAPSATGDSKSSNSGVIIGVVCAVLLVIGAAGFVWYRKKRAARNNSPVLSKA